MKDYPIDKPVERPTESDKKTRGHKYDFFSGSPTFERKTAADHTTQIIRQSSPVPLNTENRIIRTEKAPEYAKPIVREYSDIPIRANRQPIEPKFREAHRRESFNTPHAKAYEEPEIMEKIEEKPIEELPRILTPKKPIEAKFREREKLDVNKIIYARENDDFIPPKVIQADPPPVLPKIEPKPRRRLLENEDSDDQDHSEFYSWLFNGTHDMNKAKGLLFQKKL